MTRKQKKTFRWIVVIGIMVIIFYLSAQPATQSAALSKGWMIRLKVIINELGLISPYFKEWILRRSNNEIRKLAHVIIYYVLGMVTLAALEGSSLIKKKAFFIALGICVLYAVGDEVHQLFILGRSAEIRDVLIDSCGALGGIITVRLIEKIFVRNKR